MKKIFFALIAIAAVAAIALTGCKDKDPVYNEKASCLIIGNIITMDEDNPTAEAVVVQNGIIQFVGKRKDAEQYCTDNTKVLDYGTASVYPGFMEGHAHGRIVAERLLGLDLSDLGDSNASTMQDYVNRITQYVNQNPNMEIYIGFGWVVVNDITTTAEALDAICSTKPIILGDLDGHSAWLNTKAIEQYHVSDPANIAKYSSFIRVDEKGHPTGYISEDALELVRSAWALSKDEYKTGLLQWQQKAFEFGITAVSDAWLDVSDASIRDAYMELSTSGAWKLRTYAVEKVLPPSDDKELYATLNAILDHSIKYNSEYFKVNGIKIFMDGIAEGETAWLLEPYSNNDQNYGRTSFPDADVIAKAVAFANLHNLNAHFHTIGDAAVRTAVKGIIQAQTQTGITDARNAVAHLELVKPEEIELIGKNNIIPVVAPLWVPMNKSYKDELYRYIGERIETQYPIKSFCDQGCKINFHSDYPISPDFNVPQTIYAAVTRTSDEQDVYNPKEAITPEQALQAFTTNIAYQFKQENRLGKLKTGFVANMSVFNKDFLKDDMSTIIQAEVVATIVDGQVVYGQNK